jgi:predicted permease
MKNKKLSLYALAKYTNLEITMESQYLSAGAHQARLLEKFEKNKNYIKNQSIGLKVASACIIIFIPVLLLFLYDLIVGDIASSTFPVMGSVIVFSSMMSILYMLLLAYLILFGLFTTSSLMSGNTFKWIQTLPLSRKDIRKLGYMTLFRSQSIIIILMVTVIPILLLIITHNILTFFLSMISTLLITMFSISLLIILSAKFSSLFSERSRNTAKANLFRILSLLSFFIIAFGSGLMINFGLALIATLAEIFNVSAPPIALTLFLSYIPIPFAPGFLVGLSLTPSQVPLIIWLSTITGMLVFGLITFLLYEVAVSSLKSVSQSDFESKRSRKEGSLQKKVPEIEVYVTTPIRAYIRKDLVTSTRDYQSLIFVLMPIIYPIILIISMNPVITNYINSPLSVLILWAIIILGTIFIPLVLVMGLLNIEESGTTILASLPIIPRDQAKAKFTLMLVVQAISLILMAVILTAMSRSLLVLSLLVITLPFAWTCLLLAFEMKVGLFGKMKYRYVLEEVNKRHKILKWISMLLSQIGLCFFILMTGFILFAYFGILIVIIGITFIGLLMLSILIFAFIRMFPETKKMSIHKTRNFLIKKSIIGAYIAFILLMSYQFLSIALM